MSSKILIACEYSAIVRDAWRSKGFDAWSCDILPCEGDPQYHYQCDLMEILYDHWDLIIAFPPCTDLTNAQAGDRLNRKIEEGKSAAALNFIQKIWNASDHVSIENPVSGYLNQHWKPYDQIIQPYYFGHNYRKTTCLWLKNLPFLISTIYNEPEYNYIQGNMKGKIPKKWGERDPHKRNKFHSGIADAMVSQWSHLFNHN